MRARTFRSVPPGPSAVLVLAWLVAAAPGQAASQAPHAGGAGHEAMSDADMKRWTDAWWAGHPRVGVASLQAVTATFTVVKFRFDLDGSAATQVDTARIQPGESVMWQWVTGFHTVTSGVNSLDPAAGQLFDQPNDSGHQQFAFQFDNPGTYRFFCRPHELGNMTGVVIVSSTTDVGASPGRLLGFTLDPAPNPSRDGVRFGFAMRSAGRARAEVFDARGRRVARVLDRELAPGEHEAVWNGRGTDGASVRAGVYYVRLRLPGYDASRSVVMIR